VVHVLDANSWGQRHHRLQQEGGPSLAVEEPLARARREAGECEQQRQWFAAAFHLTRLIAREPTDSSLYVRRARAYDELGEWPKAAQDYAKAIELAPADSSLYVRRGRAYDERGEWPKAAQDYAKAIELGDRTESVWSRHVWLRLAIGDDDGYRQSCTRLLQQFGKTENPNEANTLAWTCVLAPDAVADPMVPVQLAEKAVTSSPKTSAYLNTLGAAHYRAGQYDRAIQRLNEAVQVRGQGGTATDWLFLALAHQKLGHADEARQWLEKAVAWIEKADQEKTLSPRHRLELQWLRREAETLVKGVKP
jgi:Flp pilus assembly protein TadD